jgi:hypothetical protein
LLTCPAGWAYDLLFLYLDGVFAVFAINNSLGCAPNTLIATLKSPRPTSLTHSYSPSYVGASLTYLNFCVGAICTFLFMPVQTYFYARDRRLHSDRNRPEARFLT